MSLAFNCSGLITQGFGEDQRVITQGYGISFDFGSYPRPILREQIKEYSLGIFTPILKEGEEKLEMYSPVEIIKDGDLSVSSSISKEVEEDLNIQIDLDHSKLLEVIDEL